MNEAAQAILCQMESLLAKLNDCPPETRSTRRNLPNHGVYVFYKNNEPLYVGRSNMLRERVLAHGRNSANQEQATFAFRLLAKIHKLEVGHGAPMNRRQIAKEYATEFREQKEQVRDMRIKAVEITNDTVSYFFEAYAILALGTTEYNKFETH